METILDAGLAAASIRYVRNVEPNGPGRGSIDYYLPDYDLYIEVKQFHSDRIAGQMAQVENIVAIQGIGAAKAFVGMLGVAIPGPSRSGPSA